MSGKNAVRMYGGRDDAYPEATINMAYSGATASVGRTSDWKYYRLLEISELRCACIDAQKDARSRKHGGGGGCGRLVQVIWQ